MKPCTEIQPNPEHIPFGTIVHFCWSDDTPEENCGTACMVVCKKKNYLYEVVQLKTFVPHRRADLTGQLTSLTLLPGLQHHHIAQEQGE